MDRTERLIRLFHRRWSVPLLAELSRGQGAKLVTLTSRLGASPGAVRETLDDLIAQGLVARNPGYGHPMRPEYILTDEGEAIGAACVRIEAAAERLSVRPIVLRKWPMPVLDALDGSPARFGELGRRLHRITDRALAMSLRELAGVSLVGRSVVGGHPPISLYRPTRRAAALIGPMAEIA
jgi:DNA-binding HxlR family transcriptional regulator